MSSVVISGDTSGAITLSAPAVAGTNTITLPAATGTAVIGSSAVSAVGQIPFSTDGTSYTPTAKIVSGTAVASTSGTSIDFTSIPSWVKRITVNFSGVSTNGASNMLVQIGSGSVTTSGYASAGAVVYGANQTALLTSTQGFFIYMDLASDLRNGAVVICLLSSNTWVASGNIIASGTGRSASVGGNIALGGTLDRVRITTVNGTDAFDAGTINILYE